MKFTWISLLTLTSFASIYYWHLSCARGDLGLQAIPAETLKHFGKAYQKIKEGDREKGERKDSVSLFLVPIRLELFLRSYQNLTSLKRSQMRRAVIGKEPNSRDRLRSNVAFTLNQALSEVEKRREAKSCE